MWCPSREQGAGLGDRRASDGQRSQGIQTASPGSSPLLGPLLGLGFPACCVTRMTKPTFRAKFPIQCSTRWTHSRSPSVHPRSGPHWLTQCLWDHQKGQHSGQALRVALVRTPRKGGPASGMKGMTAELGGGAVGEGVSLLPLLTAGRTDPSGGPAGKGPLVSRYVATALLPACFVTSGRSSFTCKGGVGTQRSHSLPEREMRMDWGCAHSEDDACSHNFLFLRQDSD